MIFLHCVLYLVVMSVTVFLIGRFFPRKWIRENSFPFRSFALEREGKVYEKIKIRKWKNKWPDASRIFHKVFGKIVEKLYPQKSINKNELDKIPVLIKESCVAEMTHVVVALLSWGCVFIWRRWKAILLSLIYFLFNIPPIIIQRYNRPRLKRTLLAMTRKPVEKCGA